ARGQRRKAADRVGVLVEDPGGHLLPAGARARTMPRQGGFQALGRLQHLTQGHPLTEFLQGSAVLQFEEVLGAEQFGTAARSRDQALVLLDEQRRQAVAFQRRPALGEDTLGRFAQQRLEDSGAEMDAATAGALAELVDDEGQTTGPVATLIAAQNVAGALERWVGVDLAQD